MRRENPSKLLAKLRTKGWMNHLRARVGIVKWHHPLTVNFLNQSMKNEDALRFLINVGILRQVTLFNVQKAAQFFENYWPLRAENGNQSLQFPWLRKLCT
jgi:hypothetical protein